MSASGFPLSSLYPEPNTRGCDPSQRTQKEEATEKARPGTTNNINPMSWTSSPFQQEPMRRRSSRSRSPDRRGYYERDWAREREWEQYERERAEWEYRRNGGGGGGGGGGMGMRGRSRSPPGVYDGEFHLVHLLRSTSWGGWKTSVVSRFLIWVST